MAGYVRPSYQGYGQAGQPVTPYQVSTPAVPGLDQKNSFVRNFQPGTAWGDSTTNVPLKVGANYAQGAAGGDQAILPQDDINTALREGQTAGPYSDPRDDQQMGTPRRFWQARRKSEADASKDYRITTAGFYQGNDGGNNIMERPVYQRGEPVTRQTANIGAPIYSFQRPFNQWRARRFNGSHATLGDAFYANQGAAVRNSGRAVFRTTEYQRPAARDTQLASTEVPLPVSILQTGGGLRKWY